MAKSSSYLPIIIHGMHHTYLYFSYIYPEGDQENSAKLWWVMQWSYMAFEPTHPMSKVRACHFSKFPLSQLPKFAFYSIPDYIWFRRKICPNLLAQLTVLLARAIRQWDMSTLKVEPSNDLAKQGILTQAMKDVFFPLQPLGMHNFLQIKHNLL